MYFMYVDESGDPGPIDPAVPVTQQSSRHYILSGVAIPASEWRNQLLALVDVRRLVKAGYGLPMRAELHGAELFRPASPEYAAIGSRKGRMALYRDYLMHIAVRLQHARPFHVHVNKDKPKFYIGRGIRCRRNR